MNSDQDYLEQDEEDEQQQNINKQPKVPKKEFIEDELDPVYQKQQILKQRLERQKHIMMRRQQQKQRQKNSQRQTEIEKNIDAKFNGANSQEKNQKNQENQEEETEEQKLEKEEIQFIQGPLLENKDIIEKIFEIGYRLLDSALIQAELNLINLQNFSAQLPALVKTFTLQDCYKLEAYNNKEVKFDLAFDLEKNRDIFKAMIPIMQKLSGSRLAYKLGDILFKFLEILRAKYTSLEEKEILQSMYLVQKFQQDQIYCQASFKENFINNDPERNTIINTFVKGGISKGIQNIMQVMQKQGIFSFEEMSNVMEQISGDIKQALSDIFQEMYDKIEAIDEQEEEDFLDSDEDENDPKVQERKQLQMEKKLQQREKIKQNLANQKKQINVNPDDEEAPTSNKEKEELMKKQQFAKDIIQLLIKIAPQTQLKIVITDEILKNLKLDEKHLKDAEQLEAGLELKYRILSPIDVAEDLPKFQKLVFQLSLIVIDNLEQLSQQFKYLRNKFFICLIRFYQLFENNIPWLYLFQLFWEFVGPRLRVFQEDVREVRFFLENQLEENPQFFEFLMNFDELEKIMMEKEILKEPLYFNNVKVQNAQPISKSISAGKSGVIYRVFEIFKPLSLISFQFSVEQKDISFAIKYLGDFQNLNQQQKQEYKEGITIISGDKVKCDVDPYKGNLLAVQPGLYVAEFSNQYSWFAEKKIQFSFSILEPTINDQDKMNKSIPIRKVLYPNFYRAIDEEQITDKFLYQSLFESAYRIIIYLNEKMYGILVQTPEKQEFQQEEDCDVVKEFLGKVFDKTLELSSKTNVFGEYTARNFVKIVPNVEIIRLNFDLKLDQL
ncbi:hypothetical protein PPERSA_08206 [Pseudocohnilembus persalinus]|uniref:GOLD domain-containing protein n=1 Tax=Pseudocohnilembus persalinus TaxID=266149 RepID=A0A0V0QFW9_PSEPJ|nr:hypothetical protein PPERSA_08206 [Pseudocohnilembus persalinus]|eukprot:KRX01105.1 hypothetical protein PPERSA_08206 [Pseudocohnilembus persalinus]